MSHIKVKDHVDLVRDTQSNAILNTNSTLYHAAKARKTRAKIQREEMNRMKRDIDEIKSLLHQLINTKNP